MKKSNLLIMTLSAFLMLLVFSCDQNEVADAPTGVEFLLAPDVVSSDYGRMQQEPVVGEGKCDLSLAAYAIVEINGENYTVDIKQWGSDYKTNLIELMPGTYNVQSFVVYGDDNNPLYATPMQGSVFDNFVNMPLPIEFTVETYQKLEYNIEVLCIEEFSPPEFGFVFWNIDLKSTKNLCIFVNYCEPNFGHLVANLEAWVYPSEEETTENDLIWWAVTNTEDQNPENDILCLKFPFDPDPQVTLEEQSYYVILHVNGVEFTGTIDLSMVDEINASDKGYLHLNENCDGNFRPFETSLNIAWEDLNQSMDPDQQQNDLDYNDFVVQSTIFTDDNGLNFHFMPKCRGAGFGHAFRMKLPGTGYILAPGSDGMLSTMAGNTYITIYDNTANAFLPSGGFVNVDCEGPMASGVEKTIILAKTPAEYTYYLLNPFTANLDVTATGCTYDLFLGALAADKSTFDIGGDTFHNGIITPKTWAWPIEGNDIREIYGNNFEVVFDPTVGARSNGEILYTECP